LNLRILGSDDDWAFRIAWTMALVLKTNREPNAPVVWSRTVGY
jgi:hypothetical protein